MINFGLMTSSDMENLFLKKEISRTCENKVHFTTLKSLLKYGDFMETCKVDAYITTLSGHEQTLEEGGNVDWFAFSWYEDYPYNILYINGSSESQTVIVPPFIRCADLMSHDSDLVLFRGRVDKAINGLVQGEIKGLLVPARLASYLEEQFHELHNYRKEILPVYEEKISKAEFVVLFKKHNSLLEDLMRYFVKSVRFVGGGVGDFTMCTEAGIEALKHAQVCLHDSLIDDRLLNYLPSNALIIDAGKRHFKHSLEQPQINKLIVKYAKLGFRVVRLKSGDPAIFGRLAEEIDYLEKHKIPHKVIPGVSSLNTLSTSGIVPTRRGVNRGICIMSPIKHGGNFASVSGEERKKLPIVFFMGIRVVDKIAKELMKEGVPKNTSVALAFSLGFPEERVIRGTLADIGKKLEDIKESSVHLPPGLFIVGEISKFKFENNLLLKNRRVLVAGRGERANRIIARFEDFGASVDLFRPPEIEISHLFKAIQLSRRYDAVVFSEKYLMHKFLQLSREYGIETAEHVFVKHSMLKRPDLKEIIGKKVFYIYMRKNNELFRFLRKALSIDEFYCPTRVLKGEVGDFSDAVFVDNESLISFIESGYIDKLKGSRVWILTKVDNDLVSILKRKSLDVNIAPDVLGNLPFSTDIRFAFKDNSFQQEKMVI